MEGRGNGLIAGAALAAAVLGGFALALLLAGGSLPFKDWPQALIDRGGDRDEATSAVASPPAESEATWRDRGLRVGGAPPATRRSPRAVRRTRARRERARARRKSRRERRLVVQRRGGRHGPDAVAPGIGTRAPGPAPSGRPPSSPGAPPKKQSPPAQPKPAAAPKPAKLPPPQKSRAPAPKQRPPKATPPVAAPPATPPGQSRRPPKNP